MLQELDRHWREHLAAMDYLRQGIHLRAYAQKNPKQEYKREAFELFGSMLDRIKHDTVVAAVAHAGAQRSGDRSAGARARAADGAPAADAARGAAVGDCGRRAARRAGAGPRRRPDLAADLRRARRVGGGSRGGPFARPGAERAPVVREGRKVGRNEPCPCGSGKKYKHCHGQLVPRSVIAEHRRRRRCARRRAGSRADRAASRRQGARRTLGISRAASCTRTKTRATALVRELREELGVEVRRRRVADVLRRRVLPTRTVWLDVWIVTTGAASRMDSTARRSLGRARTPGRRTTSSRPTRRSSRRWSACSARIEPYRQLPAYTCERQAVGHFVERRDALRSANFGTFRDDVDALEFADLEVAAEYSSARSRRARPKTADRP